MARRQILNEHGLAYITCTIVGWMDLFSRPVYRDIVIDSLRFCQTEKGLQIFAYVLMSNHLHLIVKSKDEDTLSKILHDFKKHTGKSMLKG
jgi:REP element-mobilizing transposase RayT